MIIGPDQAHIKRMVTRPVEHGAPVAFYIPSQKQSTADCSSERVTDAAVGEHICILAQWDGAYPRVARRWRRRVQSISNVHDVCADRANRDDALTAISGAGLVAYFGHASDIGFDGYHGIALEDMCLNQPIGVLVSWSCNAIFGRSAFGIRLVQSGLVGTFIGTTDCGAKTRDNAALADIAANTLVCDRPQTAGDWVVAIDKAVFEYSDPALIAAWQKFRIVGSVDTPLPLALESSQ